MRKIKRFVATILSFGMVLAGSLTAFAAEQPDQKQEQPILAEGVASPTVETADRGIYPVIGERVRLRFDAGLDSEVNCYLYASRGDWVMIDKDEKLVDGIWWLKVTACSRSMDVNGWIAKQYVDLANRIDSVHEKF